MPLSPARGRPVAEKNVATNRKARHNYEITDTVEAGLVLTGSEIKSIRAGRVSLQEAFAVIQGGEAWLVGAHIAPYEHAGHAGHDPLRRRKLLLHRRQIDDLAFRVQAKGFTLVPLRLYLRDGLAKVEVAVARGRKQHDKRQAIREREMKRDMERATGSQRK
jgi:SsrA-binding protein